MPPSKPDKTIYVYTDGGCDPNPGVGGWGAVLLYNGHRKELSGGADHTTNNRMELTAAIEALDSLKRSCDVHLYTDSQYLQRGVTEWLANWKRKGWRSSAGKVKNVDLWQRLDDLLQRHDVTWEWVRGHNGVLENERCDELAAAEIRKRKA